MPARQDAAAALAEGRLRIGLSGWSYPGWRDGFYDGVPRRCWLAHSASHFNGLEANATFYGGQKPETYARWRDETPDGFAFAAKGHRMITHLKRLRDPAEAIARQRRSLQPLAGKLSAVLWQLPENFRRDDDRLDGLMDALGKEWPEMRHAIEFRHPSWFADEVAGRLREAAVANCLSDSPRWPIWDAVTGGLVYVRLHGHSRLYRSRYATATLRFWARRVGRWLAEGREVHVYFDNDAEGHAPWDALRLKGMLGAA